jgi:hypothetical protein
MTGVIHPFDLSRYVTSMQSQLTIIAYLPFTHLYAQHDATTPARALE